MLMFSTFLIVCLNIFGLVLTSPIQQSSSSVKSDNAPLDQAFRKAEKVLNRYYHLMNSDTDHLVHGMLHVLMNNPTSFPYIPYRAMQIAFQNVEQKIGRDGVDDLTKPLLLAIEENYRNKSKQPSAVKLTEETKEKIEEALDKFFGEADLTAHV